MSGSTLSGDSAPRAHRLATLDPTHIVLSCPSWRAYAQIRDALPDRPVRIGRAWLRGNLLRAARLRSRWFGDWSWRDPALGLNRTPDGFGSPRKGGLVVFAFCDGSAHYIREDISPVVLKALSTPDGGEPIPNDLNDY